MKYLIALCIATVTTLPASLLQAQTWPQRPVKVIVPFSAGGNTDIQARLISERLSAAFGESYKAYMGRTPRCGPDFSKWRDEEDLSIKPRFFLTTIRDGLVFLLAIPVFESVDMAQAAGWLPVLLRLP